METAQKPKIFNKILLRRGEGNCCWRRKESRAIFLDESVWASYWYHWRTDHEILYCTLKEQYLVSCRKESESHSVVSDSLLPHGPYSPWNSPGQNTGVGRLSLLHGIFPTQGWNLGLLHCQRILTKRATKENPMKRGNNATTYMLRIMHLLLALLGCRNISAYLPKLFHHFSSLAPS